MDQFQERLARLTELSPEELSALESEMVAAFDAADADGDLESMQAIADALDVVRAEKSTRGEGEEEAPAEAAPEPEMVAASADAPENQVEVNVGTAEAAPDSTPAPAEEPEPESESEPADGESDDDPAPEAPDTENDENENPTPEATEADDTNESEEQVAAEITADEVPEENRPVRASAPVVTIRAGGDVPGITAGSELPDMDAVTDALVKKINSMRGVSSGDGERIVVASLRVEDDIPEERTLYPGDQNGNSKKIRTLLNDRDQLTPEGLVAAGWCAPRSPIYDVPTMGTTRRPLKDGLPSFNADRGGVTWAEPPQLPDLNAAVSLWRHDGDATWESFSDPTGTTVTSPANTKPCLTVPCGDEKSVDVDAIPLCLCFDNLASRAFPEWVRANTDLTMVTQARFAEQVLLSQMFAVAATGACGTPATQLGAARDFYNTVRAAAASLRWRLRLDINSPLQLAAPAWVAIAMAIDLGIQAPGDDTFVTSTSEVTAGFNDAGISPIWYIDDVPGTSTFSGCDFPAGAHWMLFPTGAFLRFDNGELNLGVVRTKEDLQKNAYCEFSETFEALAYMGPSTANGGGWIVRGYTDIEIIGGAAALIDTTA